MAEKWVPLPYMEAGVQQLLERDKGGLCLRPGMRKTSITLAAFTLLKEVRMAKAALVLAPLRVVHTSWPKEVRKWTDFEHLSVGILHGKDKDKVLEQKHDVYLCNYDGLKWLSERLAAWDGPLPFDMLVADESTKLKNQSTQRFKLLKPLLKKFKRRVILTGTPTARHLLDLFGQCYVMDSGETFGPYVTRFREEFFYPSGYMGYDWKPKQGAEQEIYARLAPRVYYAHDEDWLQLPEYIEKDVEVELPPKARAMYDQLENTLRLQFEQGKVTAANAAVASMKARQLCNGGIYLDGSGSQRAWEHVHEAKTEAICDLVEELAGQPALVTYDFLHDLERLKRALKKLLGEDVPHIGQGGIAPNKLPGLIKAWNRNEVPVLIVNPQSMSHGVDGLQEAGRAVIWHSLSYNFEDYEQLNARLRRSGQVEKVLVAHVIAENTVDRAVMAALKRKNKGQTGLFDALREYWKE